jgi:hypothetical protein
LNSNCSAGWPPFVDGPETAVLGREFSGSSLTAGRAWTCAGAFEVLGGFWTTISDDLVFTGVNVNAKVVAVASAFFLGGIGEEKFSLEKSLIVLEQTEPN